MKLFKRLFKKKWIRGVSFVVALTALRIITIAGAQVAVSPQAPPTGASALTTVLGYMQWLGIVGGVGLGALIAGIKIALQHDMEGGKRDLMYSIVGGIVITLLATLLNLFI
ncbi:hypothetical protein [Sulfolobus acidocaldarius]|uniref:hypothetical protein n=1 Tax=Sulfolobus acidocaldarius TaxID=2285 RepID=UPI000782BE33|nr:hypothetical protein [Sulfolobus acidocaldarius]